MDATTLNTIVGIIGIIVGLIGIVVGIIGWKSLSTATKIKNTARTGDNSTVQQAQSIHNGLDDYTVTKLSKDAAQEEIKRISITKTELGQLLEQFPRIYIGKESPKELKDGDLWFQILDE